MLQQAAQQAPQTWQGVVYILGALLISNLFMWLRELVKHREWKRKNGSVDRIEGKIDNVDVKVGSANERLIRVEGDIKNQLSVCSETREVFAETMKGHSTKLQDHETRREALVGWGKENFSMINGRLKALEKEHKE